MKAALILNSSAGTFKGNNADFSDIKNLFIEHKIDIVIFDLKEKAVAEIVEEVTGKGISVIIAAGGDGTLRSVAQSIIGKKVTFGILPMGTLNHFAKDLGIPLDPGEAVEIISKGYSVNIDAASVNGLIFLNNASLGLYPRAVKHREKQMESLGRSKWTAMIFALIGIFKRFPLFTVELNIKGKKILRTSPIIFVGNNKYEMDLFTLGSRSRLDGGKLCLYIVRCKSRWKFIILLLHILFNNLNQDEDFESYITDKLDIITGKRKITAALDGEAMELSNKLNFEILPGALNVFVPPGKDNNQRL